MRLKFFKKRFFAVQLLNTAVARISAVQLFNTAVARMSAVQLLNTAVVCMPAVQIISLLMFLVFLNPRQASASGPQRTSITPAPGVTKLSAGGAHSAAIMKDGTLWTWGYNGSGQLGNGTTTSKNKPVQIGTHTDWLSVSAGNNHNLAIKSNGSLWAWGENGFSQLGDESTTDRTVPTRIGGATNWMMVSAGDTYSLGLKTDKTLWAWGYNADGQLGDGTIISKTTPTQIGADSDWASVNAGLVSSFGVKTNGTLWAWGNNDSGQLGDGTTAGKTVPTQVGTDTHWAAVSSGDWHTIALKTDGTLWAWGYNYLGWLGDGTTTDRYTPVQIGTDTNWSGIYAGNKHNIAIKTDGTLWVWGDNSLGQLGDNTTITRMAPVQVGVNTDWESASGNLHTLTLKTNGVLWAWGYNYYGQLGDETTLGDGTTTSKLAPVQVGTDTNWTSIGSGDFHNLAIKTNGSLNTLWSWGGNWYGQLADGTEADKDNPGQIGSDTTWAAISGGDEFTLGLKIVGSVGTLWAAGDNSLGQLGDGTTMSRNTMVRIGTASNWLKIATGLNHSLGLKADGTLWAWGDNSLGQLGHTPLNNLLPSQVGSDTNWTDISASMNQSFAIKTTSGGTAKTLWAWGDNWAGQLGDGTIISKTSPTQVGLAANWSSVSAGSSHTAAIRTDGTLWLWGHNYFGQLGDGTTVNKSVPTPIGSDTNWLNVSAGYFHTMAIKGTGSGTLWGWGDNSSGQLGDGTSVNKSSPGQIGASASWTNVAAGNYHSIMLNTAKTLWSTGRNDHGQLGDGTIAQKTPVQIIKVPAQISLSSSSFTFKGFAGAANPASQTVDITNTGVEIFSTWTITDNAAWLTASPNSGLGDGGTITLSVDITGLEANTYNATITVSDPTASNSPQTAAVSLIVRDPLVIIADSMPVGTKNVPYTTQLNGSGGLGPYVTWSIIEGSLPTGLSLNSSTGVISGTPTALGTNIIRVQVTDSDSPASTAAESFTIEVSNTLPADMIISVLTVPLSSMAGKTITITDTTKNQGDTAADSSYNKYYLSDNTTIEPKDILLDTRTVPSIGPGEQNAVETVLLIPEGTKVGVRYIIAYADAGKTVGESSEVNNIQFASIDINAPDLIVMSLTIPKTATVGDIISITDTTGNRGQAVSAVSNTKYYLSTNLVWDDRDKLLDSRAVPGLSPNASNANTKSVLIPLSAHGGFSYLLAVADGDKTVNENRENNNVLSAPITINAPDLYVSSLSVSAKTTKIKAKGAVKITKKLSISDTTKNKAASKIKIKASPSVTKYYLSNDTILDETDKFLGSRNVSKLDVKGAKAASKGKKILVNIPSDIVGQFYIIAVADGNYLLGEMGEINNTKVKQIRIK